ncbi:MAG: hypothetical protein WA354_14685 [Terracidiphilus sp.]
MKNFGKFVLGVAIVAGGLGLGATSAQAAEFRVVVGGPAYVPPCPGPGYTWVAGYYSNGYWIPGAWNYVGVGFLPRGGFYVDRDHDRSYVYAHRDDRRYDRDDHRDHDGDHFRR